MLAVTKARERSIDRTERAALEKHQMIIIECPWCTERAELDAKSLGELRCETCRIVVEIAPDVLPTRMDRAA
jgi:hypothetical protein